MPAADRVRPPRQARTEAAWERILDAGVAILEESGYDGFTISAICARAAVTPPTIYARVRTKQDLFFAVFEHGFRAVREETEALRPIAREGVPAETVIREAVAAVVLTTLRHEPFLRAIIRSAEADAEVSRRTREARVITAARFRDYVVQVAEALRGPVPERIDAAFRIVFAALTTRIATPSALDLGDRIDDGTFLADLQEVAVRLLLREA